MRKHFLFVSRKHHLNKMAVEIPDTEQMSPLMVFPVLIVFIKRMK